LQYRALDTKTKAVSLLPATKLCYNSFVCNTQYFHSSSKKKPTECIAVFPLRQSSRYAPPQGYVMHTLPVCYSHAQGPPARSQHGKGESDCSCNCVEKVKCFLFVLALHLVYSNSLSLGSLRFFCSFCFGCKWKFQSLYKAPCTFSVQLDICQYRG